MKKTIEELRDYLLENYVDGDGDLFIEGLDFSEFDGNVYIGGMKVQGDLYQRNHKVQGDLYQRDHKVQGNLFQNSHEVQGSLFQNSQKVQGNYYCKNIKVKGVIKTNEPTKLLTEITLEELAELGYKIKE